MLLLKIAYAFISPPGIWILLMVALGMYQLRRNRRLSYAIFSLLLIVYICSIPFIGDAMIRSIENNYSPPKTANGDVIVMLTGGTFNNAPGIIGPGNPQGETAGRIITTAALYHQYRLPIIVSGGLVHDDFGVESRISKQALLALGVDEDSVIIEEKSKSTEENAKYVAQVLRSKHYTRPILVTSALHMARSVSLFDMEGIQLIPYPTAYMANAKASFYLAKFLPSYDAVNLVGHAFKEIIGLFLHRFGISILAF